MLHGSSDAAGYSQTSRDFHDKLGCVIRAAEVTLLTLNTSLLTFLLNQLSGMCSVRTQKKAPVVPWLLPDVMEGNFYLNSLGDWEFEHCQGLIHQTMCLGCHLPPWYPRPRCMCAVLCWGKCKPQALKSWAFWSVRKKQYVKIYHVGKDFHLFQDWVFLWTCSSRNSEFTEGRKKELNSTKDQIDFSKKKGLFFLE